MSESGQSGAPRATLLREPDLHGMIAALREQLAEHSDPVRFRFIEALARRAEVHDGEARRLLDDRLARALHEYSERFHAAQDQARELLDRMATQFPHAADDLGRFYAAGNFRALRQCAANLEAQGGSRHLADLVAHIAQHGREGLARGTGNGAGENVQPDGELKSLIYFRKTWSKLSVDRQLTQALLQAPENAGPLNPHQLVLRSLTLMRDISPEYIRNFMSYVDALLWLDQADNGRKAVQKTVVRVERDKKRKSGRGNAGE